MQQQLTFVLLLLSCLLGLPPNLQGQEFPCDGSVYYVGTNTVVGSKLYKLNVDPLTGQITSRELPLDNPNGRHITALGYNVRDRMLYGLDFDTYELLRIGSDGSLTVLGKKDIDPKYEIYSGGMTANGQRLLLVARNKTSGRDENLYSIRVNDPGQPLGSFPINADRPVAMVDVAIDPITSNSFSFDEIRRHVVETNGGQVFTNLNYKEVNEVFGSLFFDRTGKLYGLGNANGGGAEQTTIYTINKWTGETERFTKVLGGRDTDACACPYTIDFARTLTPQAVDGCSEITVEYHAFNAGGIGQLGVRLRDTFPDDFVITQVDVPQEDYFLEVISGQGSNVLAVDDWNLLVGDNTIRVQVQLMASTAGRIVTQAELSNLYAAYDFGMVSDDQATEAVDDPNVLEILDANSFELEDYVQYSCDLDTAYLHLPLRGTYEWSTGSTDSVLAVTQNGMYALTLTTDCFTVRDTIQLVRRQEPYFVDLGEDRIVKLGTPLSFSFQHNLKRMEDIRWRSLGNDSLDCTTCSTTTLTAISTGQVAVSVVDDRGCIFTDQVTYEVRQTKNIYLPTAFSPNGDGINDFFTPQGDKGTILQFDITDRWGSRIFSHSGGAVNEFEGWDGLSKQQAVAPGNYFYRLQIRFPDQEEKKFQGTVLVIR
jgi:gliding motility-associated-like protein